MSNKYRFCICLDPGAKALYEDIVEKNGGSIADAMRRMLDYASNEKIVNEIFPRISGQIGGNNGGRMGKT